MMTRLLTCQIMGVARMFRCRNFCSTGSTSLWLMTETTIPIWTSLLNKSTRKTTWSQAQAAARSFRSSIRHAKSGSWKTLLLRRSLKNTTETWRSLHTAIHLSNGITDIGGGKSSLMVLLWQPMLLRCNLGISGITEHNDGDLRHFLSCIWGRVQFWRAEFTVINGSICCLLMPSLNCFDGGIVFEKRASP